MVFRLFTELSLQVFDLNLPPLPENHPEHDNNIPVNRQNNNNIGNRDVTNRIASRRASNVQTRYSNRRNDPSP